MAEPPPRISYPREAPIRFFVSFRSIFLVKIKNIKVYKINTGQRMRCASINHPELLIGLKGKFWAMINAEQRSEPQHNAPNRWHPQRWVDGKTSPS